jgi:UDP-hydrolysing UDP-N-acetyl-D-glucosamine 2-epimerase
MTQRHIAIVITARPSYARIKTVIQCLQTESRVRLSVITAASATVERIGAVTDIIRRECRVEVIEVNSLTEGSGSSPMALTTASLLSQLTAVFGAIRPDVVVTIADRHETIATAIAATYSGIPLAHVQGGEVSGNIDERVRHAITKLADLHLVASISAHDNVLRLGEEPSTIIRTGCPSIDVAKVARDRGQLDFNVFERYGGVGERIDLSGGYLVVLHHSVTTETSRARRHTEDLLQAIVKSELPTLWFWPNVDAGADGTSKAIRSFRESQGTPRIHFFKNMTPEDFLVVVNNSIGLIGNSSTGVRECSFLGVHAVDIGSRQAGRERGANVIHIESDVREILDAISSLRERERPTASTLYGDGEAGPRIANCLTTFKFRPTKRLHSSM